MLVFAYADWCGHCKSFKPTWEKVKKAKKGKGLEIIELNADKNGAKIQELGVRGFPSVFYIKQDGGKVEFNDERNEANLSKFFDDARRNEQNNKQSGGGDTNIYQTLSAISAALAGYFFYLSTLQ